MKSALNVNEMSTLSTILLSNLDEGIFFSQISGFIMDHFEEYKAQVFEVFPDGSTLLRAENGKMIEDGVRYEKGQGLSGYVARMKRAYYSNSKRDPLLATTKRDEVVENEICVPVICDGTVIGTIHVQSDNVERKFSESDIAVINEILTSIEKPIANMKMYLIAKNLNRELLSKIELKEKELNERGPLAVKNKNHLEKVELIGHSSALVKVLGMAKKVANEDFPVMIFGEGGAGKKSLARKIHEMSARKDHAIVLIHCSALDSAVVDIELFGEVDRPGLIEKANGGTLILDDVTHLPLNIQTKLLRAIVSGEIYRVGSKVPTAVNFRIITTSKIAIDEAVEEGKFLSDLYYRLNIVSINMPNLKERAEDIKILSEHFLNHGKNSEDNKMLTSKAIEKLAAYSWPGNIRELRNIMERTYILTEDRYIDEHHLPELQSEEKIVEEVQVDYSEMTLHDLEKMHIVRTLEHLSGNKTRAAKALGITVKTLYNKLHSYGLVQAKTE